MPEARPPDDIQLYLEWGDSLTRDNPEFARKFILAMLDLQEIETIDREAIDITE